MANWGAFRMANWEGVQNGKLRGILLLGAWVECKKPPLAVWNYISSGAAMPSKYKPLART